ncbi:MAG: type III pantothenate kinase [Candidatus Tectomicrobia bacterium]|nr:type III pantothenate kinase [Candidatus Tectomicrobia bacterium]
MLLVLDVGNSNTVIGVCDEGAWVVDWRIETRKHITEDEYGVLIRNLFRLTPLTFELVTGICISCVVPPLLFVLEAMSKKYFGVQPLIVGPGVKTGMPILYDNPREVGADRIANAIGALGKYEPPCIVVDFGTATTFDAISARGEYLGGAIAPGIMISTEALFEHASKLPRVELLRPRSVIGKNTVHSMQAGLIYGYVGLVNELVRRMQKELRADTTVIATGGLARIIAEESEVIQIVDPNLTIDGLRLIYERNRSAEPAGRAE